MTEVQPLPASCTIRKANADDAFYLAEIHQICFKGSFLTLLGREALAAYYCFFAESEKGICYVAEKSPGELVGFISGWEDTTNYQKPLLKKHGKLFVGSLFKAALFKPRTSLYLIIPRISVLLRAVLKTAFPFCFGLPRLARRTREVSAVYPRNAAALSLAVLPAHRGTLASKILGVAMIDHCRRSGLHKIVGTIAVDNAKARLFWEKMGWKKLRSKGRSILYYYSLGDDTDKNIRIATAGGRCE